jgi:hypothetical protein
MGTAPVGAPPIGSPPGSGAPAAPSTATSVKKQKPSIIFMILDFLVFGGAVAAFVMLLITG